MKNLLGRFIQRKTHGEENEQEQTTTYSIENLSIIYNIVQDLGNGVVLCFDTIGSLTTSYIPEKYVSGWYLNVTVVIKGEALITSVPKVHIDFSDNHMIISDYTTGRGVSYIINLKAGKLLFELHGVVTAYKYPIGQSPRYSLISGVPDIYYGIEGALFIVDREYGVVYLDKKYTKYFDLGVIKGDRKGSLSSNIVVCICKNNKSSIASNISALRYTLEISSNSNREIRYRTLKTKDFRVEE